MSLTKFKKLLGVQYCPNCKAKISGGQFKLDIGDRVGEVFVRCVFCGEIFEASVGEEEKRSLWLDFLKMKRKKRPKYREVKIVEAQGSNVKIAEKLTVCPFCGASNDDIFFNFEENCWGWYDNEGGFHEGSPILKSPRPGYGLCLNCKHEFKMAFFTEISLRSDVDNEAQIRRECPQCGYPWFSFGRYRSFRRINRFRHCGVVGFKCLACGESFYFRIAEFNAPSFEPVIHNVKTFQSIRQAFSWEEYRQRFKTGVYGPYSWKLENADAGETPAKHVVRGYFKGLLGREKFGIKRALRERHQVDFETRIQPIIDFALENGCFNRNRSRIIEETLRFSRFLWINFNKKGRVPEYLILAVIHFVYALISREARDPERREPFPLDRFWHLLSPNRKFCQATYEKNLEFVLDCLQVASIKWPQAFKRYMLTLIA